MRSRSAPLIALAAAIVIIVTVAAGRSAGEAPRSEAALKAKIAALRAELARVRAEQRQVAVAEEPPPAASAQAGGIAQGAEPAALVEETAVPSASRSRGFVLRSLGSLKLREEKLALLRRILDGPDVATRSRALSLLKTVGGAEAALLAAGVLEKEGPSWLRSQAAGVLGELGDAAALAPLLGASRSEDLQLRAAAVEALDRLGHPAPLQELMVVLAGMLDHPDGRMREDAVELMSTFRTPAVFPALAKALGDPTNSRIREAAAEALGLTRLTEAVPCLEGALNDADPGVRQAAQAALDSLRSGKP